MLKRILLYLEHRKHDKIRRQKLFLWEAFRSKTTILITGSICGAVFGIMSTEELVSVPIYQGQKN